MIKKVSHSCFDWIKSSTTTSKEPSVSDCIPPLFEAYCKVLHTIYIDTSIEDLNITWDDYIKSNRDFNPDDPIENLLSNATYNYGQPDEDFEGVQVSWKDLAKSFNIKFVPELNAESFTKKFKNGSWPRYLVGPTEGLLTEQETNTIINIISDMYPNEDVYFRFFLMSTIKLENDLFFKGKLTDYLLFQNSKEVISSPNHVWPQSKEWCVCTDYDLTFTLIGGSRQLINNFLNSDDLECLEVLPKTGVSYLADKINS